MGAKSTFRQILEEKMGFPEGEPRNISEGNTAENDGFTAEKFDFSEGKYPFPEEKSPFETLIASLLNKNVNFKFTISPDDVKGGHAKVRATYGTPPPREKTFRPRPQEKTFLMKDLNLKANQALGALVELGSTELKTIELVSESIVKRAFRRLALRLHPDQNPMANGREFLRAHTAYSVLLKEFK